MVELYLLRHAKSDWPSQGEPDRDRVLALRGVDAARAMGNYMNQSHYRPDTILCSSATRTKQTLDLVKENWNHENNIHYSDTLYDGGAQAYFNLVREMSDTCETAMLLAHNPTIHQLALALIGKGKPQNIQTLSRKYPTCGLVVIQFETGDWSEIGQGDGILIAFKTPKTIN